MTHSNSNKSARIHCTAIRCCC